MCRLACCWHDSHWTGCCARHAQFKRDTRATRHFSFIDTAHEDDSVARSRGTLLRKGAENIERLIPGAVTRGRAFGRHVKDPRCSCTIAYLREPNSVPHRKEQ